MTKLPGFILWLLTATLMLAASTLSPALAERQETKGLPTWVPTKVLFDNDRVRVQEVTFRPGDEGPNVPRPFRIIRVLEGGTMQHTYSDGRTEKVVYQTGEVRVHEADKPYVPRNIGKSYITFYVVALKQPQK